MTSPIDCSLLVQSQTSRRVARRRRHCHMLLLLLFRCCNQRLPTELLSSIADAGADAHAVATGDQSTAVTIAVVAA